MCQQHYPPQRRNGGNGDRAPNGHPGNGGHYPYTSGGGCGVPHGPSGNPYGGGSDSSSSSDFERKHRHDEHTQH